MRAVALWLLVATSALAQTGEGFTGVEGTVVDAETGETLIDATVKVVSGGQGRALTDVDGNFQLALPAGTYDLRVFYEMYEGQRISNVVVKAGEATRLEVKLQQPRDVQQEEVVVEAKADTRSESALLAARRNAATVSDAVSAQEIARSPDSAASDAVKRVVSATIVDNRYVVLRGLGGRYVSTLLNGVAIPSPEPDTQAVPLDLFPAALLANMTVLKSYDPAYPGSFGGGALLLETNSYPTKFDLRVKASIGANSETTFRTRNASPGTRTDWFGFGAGTRALPDAVPQNGPLLRGRNGLTTADVERIGESFNNAWTPRAVRAAPNVGFGITAGDTVSLGARRLGYLATLQLSHNESIQRAVYAKVRTTSEGLDLREQLSGTLGTESATVGGLLNVGLQLAPSQELNLLLLATHAGDNRTQVVSGLSENDGLPLEATRLQYLERSLGFAQLSGYHRLSAQGAELRWQANGSLTGRDEPDTRDVAYNINPDGTAIFKDEPNSGRRSFFSLADQAGGGSFSLMFPVGAAKLRGGASAQWNARRFDSRSFRFNPWSSDPAARAQGPEQLFSPENIGPVVEVEEITLSTDAYTARMWVLGGFLSVEAPLTARLRASGGVRYEVSQQVLSAGTPFAVTRITTDDVNRTDPSALPSLNLVYALTPRANLRAAYAYTLARPQFRELAPFLYFETARRRSVSGNPDLVLTRIHHVDARWEWFPSDSEVLAASAFYKGFQNPIEQVIVNASQGDLGFANARSARAVGLELEARASLQRVAAPLSPFRVGANLTLIDSQVQLSPEQVRAQTHARRPLQGQSSYVVNANVGYASEASRTEITALYNVYGPRISEVGIEGQPDTYEQPFPRVDVAVSQGLTSWLWLKASVANLFDSRVLLQQGAFTVLRYRPGVSGALQLEGRF